MRHELNPGQKRFTPLTLNGRTVGHVIGNVLKKSIDGEKHMLKNPPAIAFDCGILDRAEGLGATDIEVYDMTGKATYRVSMAEFRARGRMMKESHYGQQMCLLLHFWRKDGELSRHEQVALEREQKAERERIQAEREAEMRPSLFDLEEMARNVVL